MEFKALKDKAVEVKEAYTTLNRIEGHKTWELNEYMQGFVGDVGDLSKLLMAKRGFWFSKKEVDSKLEHELSDCLYSLIIIADELGIDLEKAFVKTMDELTSHISERELILPME